MIPGTIDDLDINTLQGLIENEVREDKTLEYKREMPGKADSDLVPFLATVSSLANTAGGDFLLGVEAKDGKPVALPGIEIDNLDGEILRFDQLLRDRLEPRLPHVNIHPIKVADDKYVLVFRVLRSWIAPHRIKKNSKFYARNSAGRYELDVGELRTAFTISESLATRIRDFRTDRLAKIHSRETPVPLKLGGCMVVHAIPLGTFMATRAIDIAAHESSIRQFPPLWALEWDGRVNLDGFVNFVRSQENSCLAYTQIFRAGVVESVAVLSTPKDRPLLPCVDYEKNVIKFLARFFEVAGEFETAPPYYAFLSFVGVRGCLFVRQPNYLPPHEERPLQEDMLILPEIVIQDCNEKPDQLLRPIFDMVWNAFGFIRSTNYDEQNNWVGW